MVEEKGLIVIIVLMAIVTYIPRALPLQIEQKHWPKWIKSSLEFLPVAIVASITMPNIIINGYNTQFLNPEFITTLFAIIVAYVSKNLIITVLLSLLFFVIAKHYLLAGLF